MSAAELRKAAAEERREWGGDQNARNYPRSSAIHLALADWLDWTYDQGHSGDMDDNGCSECAPALEVARLINGGAA